METVEEVRQPVDVAAGAARRFVGAAASIAVREILSGPPLQARRLAAFPQAVYLAIADGGEASAGHGGRSPDPRGSPARAAVIAITDTSAVRLPNAVVVAGHAGRDLLGAFRGWPATTVGEGRLIVGDTIITVGRWWDPRPKVSSAPAASDASRVRAVTAAVTRLSELRNRAPMWHWHDTAFGAAVGGVRDGLLAGDPAAVAYAAQRLLGRGPGLTPAGDDVLAGVLAGLRVVPDMVGRPIPAWLDGLASGIVTQAGARTTALSASLLAHAARGEVAAPAGALLDALGGRGSVVEAARQLMGVGHTSGTDLLCGLVEASAAVLAEVSPSTVAGASDGMDAP